MVHNITVPRPITARLLPPIFPILAAAGLLIALLLYRQTFRESTIDLSVGRAAAEQRALQALAARPGGGPVPGDLRLLARRVTRQPNRTDQAFTWERPALQRGDATYRYTVTIIGDRVGRFDEFYNIPESWSRLARW